MGGLTEILPFATLLRPVQRHADPYPQGIGVIVAQWTRPDLTRA
jgi:hypothetical protein